MKKQISVTKQHKDIELQLCLFYQKDNLIPRDIIKLDFDGITLTQFLKNFKQRRGVLWFYKIQILKVKVCSSNHGYHVYITTNRRIPNKDLVFYQVALGSDIYRECFYWKRVKYPVLPNKQWNILFHKKFYNDGTYGEEKEMKSLTNKIYKILTNTEIKKTKGGKK